MKVSIKDLAIAMPAKNKGIALEIRDNQDNHLGDLVVRKSGLVWCPGRTRRRNGIVVSWDRFIALMQERS